MQSTHSIRVDAIRLVGVGLAWLHCLCWARMAAGIRLWSKTGASCDCEGQYCVVGRRANSGGEWSLDGGRSAERAVLCVLSGAEPCSRNKAG